MASTRLSRRWFVVLGALMLWPRGAGAQDQERPVLPDYLTASIDDSIERGKNYLRRTQTNTGTWATTKTHIVGYAALPALTLLECGVPPGDPGIQRAATFVRLSVPSKELTSTYEVSLALLFLDRLGNPKDKPYIEILAGRLIASQTPTGGWGYETQYLSAIDTAEIIKYVRQLEPLPLNHLLSGRVISMYNPFVKSEPVPGSDLVPKRTVKLPGRFLLLPCFTQFGTFPLVDPTAENSAKLAPFLKHTDNSTTQFALLALWAARRHNIPCTRTGALTFMRFHTGQNSDGSWGYEYKLGGSAGSATMINTGLLGMAVGHGIVKEMKLNDDPPVDSDPRILNGFKALYAHVGTPKDRIKNIDYPNMYFLWGLERVCMLYNVHTVGDRDWYHWAAEALVANQDPEGFWHKKDPKGNEIYPGASPTMDTSFALMVLKRANLAQDLSTYLTFSPKKMNEGVVKLMPQLAIAKPSPKPEPPKVTQAPPEIKPAPQPPPPQPKPQPPIQVAEAKSPQQPVISPPITPPTQTSAPAPASSGGSTWWIWLLIGLGTVMILGGAVFIVLMNAGGGEEDGEGDERRRKKKKFKKARR
jgi:hypothetical protein